MKQEEFYTLADKVKELQKEVEEKGGTMLIVAGDVDNGMLNLGMYGTTKDIAAALSYCASKEESIKYVLEQSVLEMDIVSGAREKRRKKAKVLWIATAIVFAVLAVIEMYTALEVGDVWHAVGLALRNIGFWMMCFLTTKAQLRV